jgi:Mg2+/Co2+ transporter CorB
MHDIPSAGDIGLGLAAFIVLTCILLSAFFSASETALTAASLARMHARAKAGDAHARIVIFLLSRRARLIGAMLLGNTMVNIGASAFMTNLLVRIFGDSGMVIATVFMTILLLIFSEVLPKTIAITRPDTIALIVATPARLFVALFSPILVAVDICVGSIMRIFGMKIGQHTSILSTREELMSAVDLLHKEGGVEREHRDMLGGILVLDELTISDVMIHRTKMHTINIDLPAADLVHDVLASAYTRIPVWKNDPENIVGILHAKELLRALSAVAGDASKLDIHTIANEPWFVPSTTTLRDQLKSFRQRKTHFALAVDEYGVVMGLITLEDILEEIVGDIHDELDIAVQGIKHLSDGSITAEGSISIRDLNRIMDWSLPDDEATTIAGLVIHEARAIPDVGQIFSFHGFRFEVTRKMRNRITLLKIKPIEINDQDRDG